MLIKIFLEYLQFEKNYSIKTIDSYRVDLFQFEKYANSFDCSITLPEVDTDIIRNWILHLMQNKYSSTSVNRKLSSLRTFYKFLLTRNMVTNDPTQKVVGLKKKKRIPTFLKEAEIDKILDETEYKEGFIGIRDKLIIETFYTTGIRLSELVNLNDRDIEISTTQIKVTGKRNKQRIIPFGDELKNAILNYINIRDTNIAVKAEAFFIDKNGERIKQNSVYKLVRRQLSKVVTVKKRSPHILRHTFATSMLNNEAELSVIKELLGHNSLTATEVYTHTTFEELKKIYKQAHPRA